jgi:hypothetical protein
LENKTVIEIFKIFWWLLIPLILGVLSGFLKEFMYFFMIISIIVGIIGFTSFVSKSHKLTIRTDSCGHKINLLHEKAKRRIPKCAPPMPRKLSPIRCLFIIVLIALIAFLILFFRRVLTTGYTIRLSVHDIAVIIIFFIAFVLSISVFIILWRIPYKALYRLNEYKIPFSILTFCGLSAVDLVTLFQGLQGLSKHYEELKIIALVGVFLAVITFFITLFFSCLTATSGIESKNRAHFFLCLTFILFINTLWLYIGGEAAGFIIEFFKQ